jgi:small subunit ribosomal protein S27Ae
MAKAGAKGSPGKGKSQKKTRPANKMHTIYKVQGDKLERINRTCPKCGAGVFMGNHKDRTTCGKCGYMEKR